MVLHFKVERSAHRAAAGKILEISGRTEVMVQRALALGRAGFDVTGVVGVKTARTLMEEDRYAVVIVGSAVKTGERALLLAEVRRLQPQARVLGMSDATTPVAGVDALLDSAASPAELVRAVQHLVISESARA